jgi:hypothetical protein
MDVFLTYAIALCHGACLYFLARKDFLSRNTEKKLETLSHFLHT